MLTDGLLPDGTGVSVADKASEHGTRALIITGYAARLHPDILRYPYLLKPLRPEEPALTGYDAAAFFKRLMQYPLDFPK